MRVLEGHDLNDEISSNPEEALGQAAQSKYEIVPQDVYLDKLAPMSSDARESQDFSTASLLKFEGPNLTSEILCQECGSDYKKMVMMILQRCQIIDLKTLLRIL